MKSVFLSFIFIFSIFTFAQEAADEKEKLIRQKVKLRSYPGGFEEEPLRVQLQLNTVTRKMAPVQEIIEEPAAGAGDQAHD